MNSIPDPEKKRFRLPERIKQQNEAIFRRKLDRALQTPPKKETRKAKSETSTIKLAAIWLILIGAAYLLIRYGIRPPR